MELDKDAYEGRKEVWTPVPGYEGMYDISTIGRARSYLVQSGFNKDKRLKEPVIMKPQTHGLGYLYVTLRKDGKDHKGYIHNLMGKAYRQCQKTESAVQSRMEYQGRKYVACWTDRLMAPGG